MPPGHQGLDGPAGGQLHTLQSPPPPHAHRVLRFQFSVLILKRSATRVQPPEPWQGLRVAAGSPVTRAGSPVTRAWLRVCVATAVLGCGFRSSRPAPSTCLSGTKGGNPAPSAALFILGCGAISFTCSCSFPLTWESYTWALEGGGGSFLGAGQGEGPPQMLRACWGL